MSGGTPTSDTDAGPVPIPAEPLRSRLDGSGNERPVFLLDFPADPELEALIAAFEAGNYARVREAAPRLAASTESAAVRDAALELRRRIDPDPLARYVVLGSVALLVFLSLWAYGH